MKTSLITGWVLCAAMAATAWTAQAVRPTLRLADLHEKIVLADAIPTHFGQWTEDVNQVSAVINPQVDAEIKRIYAQTLSRTYVNADGERIMLAVAYGTDQRDNLAVHYPEGCYGAQGFNVSPVSFEQLNLAAGAIPATRLVASLNNRVEPITYWVVVGDRAVRNSWELKKARLAYALEMEIPDATLIRVSSIGGDSAAAYRLQERFVGEMLAAVPPKLRDHFSGRAR
ncbi:EpsI family protein [Rugamonas sp. FT82W]|uniref:EpsI family protein n=1 Tax=Duganella vulcania TaxID=2692166 RepID=A0A845G5C4_9BURK|nr:exosortase-associated protein EpsI, B-type [Duganella vulcania]MYM88089.1 EpsI family protein [Duganella vulcania]